MINTGAFIIPAVSVGAIPRKNKQHSIDVCLFPCRYIHPFQSVFASGFLLSTTIIFVGSLYCEAGNAPTIPFTDKTHPFCPQHLYGLIFQSFLTFNNSIHTLVSKTFVISCKYRISNIGFSVELRTLLRK